MQGIYLVLELGAKTEMSLLVKKTYEPGDAAKKQMLNPASFLRQRRLRLLV
jgi:hypothetical protein